MERTKRHLRGERYLRTVADDIGDDHMMSSLIERRLENELLAAKRGDVIYDMFHGDINISDTNGFVIQQNVGKRTMPRAKLGDINAFNPESRKESIRTTLRLMGVQGQSQRTVITKQASVTELDDNNSTLTRESNSPNTSEKLKPDSATPPLSRRYLTKHARKRKVCKILTKGMMMMVVVVMMMMMMILVTLMVVQWLLSGCHSSLF